VDPFRKFRNFTLSYVEFQEHTLQLVFLSPAAVTWIQMILKQYYQVETLPFLHTTGYRHSAFVDVNNLYGLGHNAIISWGGPDRKKSHVLASSIIEYLETHRNRLLSNYFYNQKGFIEGFPADPRLRHGSVTVSNGVKVEASSFYIHYFSTFDSSYYT
jgi:hypothetical protein